MDFLVRLEGQGAAVIGRGSWTFSLPLVNRVALCEAGHGQYEGWMVQQE